METFTEKPLIGRDLSSTVRRTAYIDNSRYRIGIEDPEERPRKKLDRGRNKIKYSGACKSIIVRWIGRPEAKSVAVGIFIIGRTSRNTSALSTSLRKSKKERGCSLLLSAGATGRPREPLSGKGRNEVISVGLQSPGERSQKDSLQLSAPAELRCDQSGVLGPDPLRPRGNPLWPQGTVRTKHFLSILIINCVCVCVFSLSPFLNLHTRYLALYSLNCYTMQISVLFDPPYARLFFIGCF